MVLILAAHESHLEAFTNFNTEAKALGEGKAFQGAIVVSSVHFCGALHCMGRVYYRKTELISSASLIRWGF